MECLGPSNREDVLAKKKKSEYPKPNAILVFVDSFTRYTKLFPVFDKSADTVRRCLHMHSNLYFFKFRDCKFVKVIQDYIKKNESLHYLLRDTISNDGEKRRSVGKYSNPSSAYISNFYIKGGKDESIL